MKLHILRLLLLVGLLRGAADTAVAQEITPVFPANGAIVSFFDLSVSGIGFQWNAPAGATGFTITVMNPSNLQLPRLDLPAPNGSPLYLEQRNQLIFTPGNYTWQVKAKNASGGDITSPVFSFQVTTGGIRPTPGTPPVSGPPSGDANSSARIDTPDIYILASQWGRIIDGDHSNDLNQDGLIDSRDILMYVKRFGQSAVPPTPTPLVGKPRNLHFLPNNVIGFSELPDFQIVWDTPNYPSESLYYEIVIVTQFGTEIHSRRFLETPFFKPPGSLTQDGIYTVYLRAKTNAGVLGEIVTGTFTIDRNRVVPPTPTPIPIVVDLNGDGTVNGDDASLFILLFGSVQGDGQYLETADYNRDGVINVEDLLIFQDLFGSQEQPLPAPQWVNISRPVMQPNAVRLCEEFSRLDIPLTPPDYIFEEINPSCIFAELIASTFNFSTVDGAFNYFFSFTVEGEDQPRLEEFTNGETSITGIPLLERGITILVQVQAVDEGLQLGAKSQVLRVTIPDIEE